MFFFLSCHKVCNCILCVAPLALAVFSDTRTQHENHFRTPCRRFLIADLTIQSTTPEYFHFSPSCIFFVAFVSLCYFFQLIVRNEWCSVWRRHQCAPAIDKDSTIHPKLHIITKFAAQKLLSFSVASFLIAPITQMGIDFIYPHKTEILHSNTISPSVVLSCWVDHAATITSFFLHILQ